MTGGKKTQTTEKLTTKTPNSVFPPPPIKSNTPKLHTYFLYESLYIFIQESVSDFIYLLVSQSLKIGGPLK